MKYILLLLGSTLFCGACSFIDYKAKYEELVYKNKYEPKLFSYKRSVSHRLMVIQEHPYPLAAINALKKKANPSAEDYADAAGAHFLRGEYDESLDCVRKGLSLEPENASLLYQRAIIYFALEQFEKAEADFLACWRINPGTYVLDLWELRRDFLGKTHFIKEDLTKKQLKAFSLFRKNKDENRDIYFGDFLGVFPRCYKKTVFLESDKGFSVASCSEYDKPYFIMSERDVKDLMGPPHYLRYDYFESGIDKRGFEYVYELNNESHERFLVCFYKGHVVSVGIE